MSLVTLLPFIVLIGAMFLMTRSAKRKQQAAATMRNEMQPGTGVRTIGGMYATVKEINEDSVLLEIAPGVHAVYGKNAIGAVLDDAEYNRIVHGETAIVPDDASSLTELDEAAKVDLGKHDVPDADAASSDDAEDADQAEATSEDKADKAEKKNDGEGEAK
ncbi:MULTISPECIES: preprotein translocase subunit YajC [unclassified Streptomyces]|uniref:preprotein translocase subunit YajC n=1 Tax=unclassified Streptomyces TaxID=2593676 RepID=UPI002E14A762|nr:preprotein translocase subunit YajC [Streptomyces sp. NBC_01197]WSS48054.1 preprotein translocase subunit YajC [Streptomyces sp. NBC_01180]